MSRLQLALNVDDLETSIAFYSTLFGTEPHKLRPGYANFAVAEPPLKLVLIENPGKGGSVNHLGVEVASSEEVVAATARFASEGMRTSVEEQVACGYAVQDKVWVEAPDGGPWEIYTVRGASDVAGAGCSVEACSPAGCAPSSCAPAGRDNGESGA